MTDPLLSFAAQHGIWAFLFLSLYLHQLREVDRRQRESAERERKLRKWMTTISTAFEAMADDYRQLSEDVDCLKNTLQRSKRKSSG